MGLPSWLRSLVGKILWRREWLPTPVSLSGEEQVFSPGQRLVGYSLWGCKESNKTEWLTLSLFTWTHVFEPSGSTYMAVFFNSEWYNTTEFMVGWTMDAELWIERNHRKERPTLCYMCIFNCTRISSSNLHVVQGSIVFKFIIYKLYHHREDTVQPITRSLDFIQMKCDNKQFWVSFRKDTPKSLPLPHKPQL